jgi:molecular chaperone DnaK
VECEIDLVLLVGGSSLIPQVRTAVATFFHGARVCTFADPLDIQLAVSRGAAWHAFFLEAMGRPFMQPVVGETIALLTHHGEPVPLIPAGSPLPYPPDGGYASMTNLAVPEAFTRELQMEIIALSNRQTLFAETWHINTLVNAGDPITVG